MGKRGRVGKCVHCCREVANISRDHLLPAAWYPSYTPRDYNRPTFPACRDCNGRHGQCEERLLRSLGLTLDLNTITAAGIPQRVVHSMSMTEAPNSTEAGIRGKIKAKYLNNLAWIPEGADTSQLKLLPGLDHDPQLLARGGFAAGMIDIADIRIFVEKIVRGVMYLEYQLFVPREQEIRLLLEHEQFLCFANNILQLRIDGALRTATA